jgi:hypothetical protein
MIAFFKKYWRISLIFAVLAAAGRFWIDPRASIEWAALLFFAAVGASSTMLDYASMRLTIASSSSRAFQVRRHILRVSFLSMVSGLALATGGGAIRRSIEWIVATLLVLINFPLRSCYTVSGSIFPPDGDNGWSAIGYGIIAGGILGILLTWEISDTEERKSLFEKETLAVDGFGTGFFTAYGVEAAIKLIDALPFGDRNSIPIPLYSAVHIFTFYGLGFLIVAGCSLMTGCGGGLLKDLLINTLMMRWKVLRERCTKWFTVSAVRYTGAIGLVAWIPYMIFDKHPVLGVCRTIDSSILVPLMLVSSFVGIGVWIKLVQHEAD